MVLDLTVKLSKLQKKTKSCDCNCHFLYLSHLPRARKYTWSLNPLVSSWQMHLSLFLGFGPSLPSVSPWGVAELKGGLIESQWCDTSLRRNSHFLHISPGANKARHELTGRHCCLCLLYSYLSLFLSARLSCLLPQKGRLQKLCSQPNYPEAMLLGFLSKML